MIVMKFGGSSLASGERIQYAADLVLRYLDRSPVVVVSAMGGVTDGLLGVARLALQGRRALSSVEAHLGALRDRHFEALSQAAPGTSTDVKQSLDDAFVELHEICTGIALLGELSARSDRCSQRLRREAVGTYCRRGNRGSRTCQRIRQRRGAVPDHCEPRKCSRARAAKQDPHP